jgi:Lustrin, cysteine-rich repeated domain
MTFSRTLMQCSISSSVQVAHARLAPMSTSIRSPAHREFARGIIRSVRRGLLVSIATPCGNTIAAAPPLAQLVKVVSVLSEKSGVEWVDVVSWLFSFHRLAGGDVCPGSLRPHYSPGTTKPQHCSLGSFNTCPTGFACTYSRTLYQSICCGPGSGDGGDGPVGLGSLRAIGLIRMLMIFVFSRLS